MTRKAKFLLMLVSLSILLSLMSSTYSRYVANALSDINASFSKWQILVNNTDITGHNNSTLPIEPVIEENEHVSDDIIAPSSKGYFDIAINPTNVDVSFKYIINLEIENENIPDLMISKYAVLPDTYVEGDELNLTYLTGNVIENTMIFNKNIESFRFQSFTIRVYFEWYDGEDKAMSDEDHTNIGYLAATEEIKLKMNANISFEQIID